MGHWGCINFSVCVHRPSHLWWKPADILIDKDFAIQTLLLLFVFLWFSLSKMSFENTVFYYKFLMISPLIELHLKVLQSTHILAELDHVIRLHIFRSFGNIHSLVQRRIRLNIGIVVLIIIELHLKHVWVDSIMLDHLKLAFEILSEFIRICGLLPLIKVIWGILAWIRSHCQNCLSCR